MEHRSTRAHVARLYGPPWFILYLRASNFVSFKSIEIVILWDWNCYFVLKLRHSGSFMVDTGILLSNMKY